MLKISEALRRARTERGLTKQAVADAIGMKRESYLRYERDGENARAPHIDKLLMLADFYGISLDYLVGRTDDPNGGYQPPVDGQEAQQ